MYNVHIIYLCTIVVAGWYLISYKKRRKWLIKLIQCLCIMFLNSVYLTVETSSILMTASEALLHKDRNLKSRSSFILFNEAVVHKNTLSELGL